MWLSSTKLIAVSGADLDGTLACYVNNTQRSLQLTSKREAYCPLDASDIGRITMTFYERDQVVGHSVIDVNPTPNVR